MPRWFLTSMSKQLESDSRGGEDEGPHFAAAEGGVRPDVEARYGRDSWITDAILGGLGLALLSLWTAVLLPSLWATLPGVGVVGSLYLLARMFWLSTVVYRVNEDDGKGGTLERRALFLAPRQLDLGALERVDLAYLGTLLRGARGKRGLFVLHLKGPDGQIRVESKVEGFHRIASRALTAFINQGHEISLATYDNASALELDVRLRTEMIGRLV
ncbi:MAG: hypothetical protein EVA88_01105 [Rhodospirillaceae bacterium]|nr:MAG: hypothetical protein EVA88_01105 [Rhodospirillaceae bacterium]